MFKSFHIFKEDGYPSAIPELRFLLFLSLNINIGWNFVLYGNCQL